MSPPSPTGKVRPTKKSVPEVRAARARARSRRGKADATAGSSAAASSARPDAARDGRRRPRLFRSRRQRRASRERLPVESGRHGSASAAGRRRAAGSASAAIAMSRVTRAAALRAPRRATSRSIFAARTKSFIVSPPTAWSGSRRRRGPTELEVGVVPLLLREGADLVRGRSAPAKSSNAKARRSFLPPATSQLGRARAAVASSRPETFGRPPSHATQLLRELDHRAPSPAAAVTWPAARSRSACGTARRPCGRGRCWSPPTRRS